MSQKIVQLLFYFLGCRGQHHNQGLDFIDTLTAPTLQPRPGEEAVEVSSSGGLFSRPPIEKPRNAGLINRRKDYNEDSKEEKLTIITPSSVVVMSTPATRPRPTTITASVPPTSEEASTQSTYEFYLAHQIQLPGFSRFFCFLQKKTEQ